MKYDEKLMDHFVKLTLKNNMTGLGL